MRSRFAIFVLIGSCAVASAQRVSSLPPENDPRQTQLQAATANGTAVLREQILHTRVNHDFLVGDYLKTTQGLDELNSVLQSAQPVGGARWVDDHTCQVQMELPGPQVAKLLMSIAHDPSRHSPIRADALQEKLSSWNHVKFSVVGSSVGGEAITNARPRNSTGKWAAVSVSARTSAMEAAHADAVKQMLNGIGSVSLTADKTISDAMRDPQVAGALNAWLQKQAVTNISFEDDLKVSVTMSVTPQSLANHLRNEIEADRKFTAGRTFDWARIDREISRQPMQVSGVATVELAAMATSLPSVILPIQPPDWVDTKLEAEGSASGKETRLKLGRAAQVQASEKVRAQLLLLHISPELTLGDAARADPQIQQAVDRAMLHARTSRVDYHQDGSVQAQVSLDLQDAWDELRANP